MRPSGVTATAWTGPPCPSSVLALPVARSQTRTVPSDDPETAVRPSDVNATA